jgi:hypothetical protein
VPHHEAAGGVYDEGTGIEILGTVLRFGLNQVTALEALVDFIPVTRNPQFDSSLAVNHGRRADI